MDILSFILSLTKKNLFMLKKIVNWSVRPNYSPLYRAIILWQLCCHNLVLSRKSHDAIIMPECCNALWVLAMLYLSFSDELSSISVHCLNLILFLSKTVVDSLKPPTTPYSSLKSQHHH